MQEKKTRKRATPAPLSLGRVTPSTPNQEIAFKAYANGQHLMLSGMAGTGKTFISLFMALRSVEFKDYERVVIVRSIVPTRDPGFLPGSLKEKTRVYEQPYETACSDLYDSKSAYDTLRNKGTIEFVTTSYLRGITLSNCVVIVDELQNMRYHEIDSIITRIGTNCRLICLGDYKQSDLIRESERGGIVDFLRVVQRLNQFSHVEFGYDDILRSDLVRDYLIARDQLGIV
jgi:phosphate starvation-inducible PhoH-like protein